MSFATDQLLELSAQQVFELSARHLLRQGRQSWNNKFNVCAYRQNWCEDDEVRCPVGYFIPDHIYSDRLECKSISGLIDEFFGSYIIRRFAGHQSADDVGKFITFLVRNRELLADLQYVHDARAHTRDPDVLSPDSSLRSISSQEFDPDLLRANLIRLGRRHNLDTSSLTKRHRGRK